MSAVPNTPRLVILFNLTNPSASMDASVLTYGTPFEGIFGPIFEVTDKWDNQIPYIGKVARRAWPPIDSTSAYLRLRPMATQSISVDLTEEFEFPRAGEYRIRFVPPEMGEDVIILVDTEDVIGRIPIIHRKVIPKTEQLGNTNCNGNQNNQITAAVSGAKTESLTAYNCLFRRTCSSLSTRWFGVYNQNNYEYDTGVFNKVYGRLNNFLFNAYCNPAGCGNNVYGYVYPTDPTFTVYLCGAFWSQANERVNTVVHEMSHFNTLGGTNDYAYGKTACLNLARSNPARASRNADNVCYFSEEAAFTMAEVHADF